MRPSKLVPERLTLPNNENKPNYDFVPCYETIASHVRFCPGPSKAKHGARPNEHQLADDIVFDRGSLRHKAILTKNHCRQRAKDIRVSKSAGCAEIGMFRKNKTFYSFR
jgi:hypothetical protein